MRAIATYYDGNDCWEVFKVNNDEYGILLNNQPIEVVERKPSLADCKALYRQQCEDEYYAFIAE